ncbi:MAG: CoA ester lyase [Acidobacteriaceae bacterium]|nr:CoA ester lyase [Acidobacteriaceae bacterium]
MNRVQRSYLFVPGNRPDRFAKAFAAGADAVIVDLEDAVPRSQKNEARQAAADWLAQDKPTFVRINDVTTEWFRGDLDICSLPAVSGVLLPKAERVENLAFIERKLNPTAHILPLIETAKGFSNARELARMPRVQRLIFGEIDFQIDLGIKGAGEELLYFQSELVLISRIAGIQAPVAGINAAIDDAESLRADTLRARRLGFGAKLLIHPKQVAIVHECFRPSAEEIAWAKRVLDAASTSQGAAVSMNGQLVDRPIVAQAESILLEADQRSGGTESMNPKMSI